MAFVIKCRQTNEIIAQGREEDGDVLTLEGCWYFKPELVNQDMLTITERTYTCPYKGVCNWVDITTDAGTVKEIGFVYLLPKSGYEPIAGRIAFYGRDTSATIALEIEDAKA